MEENKSFPFLSLFSNSKFYLNYTDKLANGASFSFDNLKASSATLANNT